LLKLLNAFALIACAFYVRAITGKAWLAFSLLINPLMLLNTLHTPHTDVILSMLILAAFYHGAPAPRGVLLALAALIKPHVLVLAPFFERKWRGAWRLAAVIAATTAVLLFALKSPLNINFSRMLQAAIRASSASSPLYSLLLANLFPNVDRNTVIVGSYGLFA